MTRVIARRVTRLAAAAALLACALPLRAADNPSSLSQGFSGAPLPDDAEVRRHEWVLTLRIEAQRPEALGRAQIAAGRAGGAVLASTRWQGDAQHADYRLLVRTLDSDDMQAVLAAVRRTPGVVGAASASLPDTPTWSGGPGFLESYRGGQGLPQISNAGRVVVRHDVPPVADASELLEMSDAVVGPSLPDLEHLGGFTLNVSEWARRVKESRWRQREEKMKNAPLEILPPEGGDAQSAPASSSPAP